jgi:hypothetical protein
LENALLDRILARMSSGEHKDEVVRARSDYFEHLRDLREDDPSFERLTSCFLNWYLLDRPMDSGLGTPIQIFAATEELSDEERGTLSALAANVHSLFEILRIEEGALKVRDLFSREIIRVHERRRLAGIDPGDILEARLLPIGDNLVFAAGAFVLHPRQARTYIRKAIERSRREGSPPRHEVIRRLQALNFRFTDRYQHRVPAAKVYADLGI